MRHKGMRIGFMAACLVFGLTLTAQATLIGDSVDFRLVISSFSFDQNGSTVVAADATDAVTLGQGIPSFRVDPFDSGVVLTSLAGAISLGPGSSFEFSNLQWQDLPGEVIGLTITNNWLAFNGMTSFTDDSVRINFDRSHNLVIAGQQLTVTLQTQHSAVPEPSTMLLMGSGLAGLLAWRRRQRSTNIQ